MQTFPGIPVYSPHYNVGPTAEMAIALLLAAAKMIVPFDRKFRRHRWASPFQDTPGGVALEGKTALILGYGTRWTPNSEHLQPMPHRIDTHSGY